MLFSGLDGVLDSLDHCPDVVLGLLRLLLKQGKYELGGGVGERLEDGNSGTTGLAPARFIVLQAPIAVINK